MSTYICKCGQRVQKSSSADNTGNRLKGYGPGHECYGCPYAMPWGGNEWNETAKRFVQDIKGYECRMSRTLSYGSLFIGSTKDKCTCSVFSLDFDFLEQISTWVKDTFSQGELTGGFSRDEIRPTDYSHNGRYCCTFVCAANKKGISAKAALLARFFNPDGNRKGMTPQQEMEKILTDIKKAKEGFSCASAPSVDAAATTDTPAPCICSTCTCGGCKEECFGNCHGCGNPVQECNSYQTEGEKHLHPAHSADVTEPVGNIPAAPSFDFSPLGELSGQAAEADQQFDLHYGAAQDEYLISCIYLARIHALTAKAGRYGGGTWTKWYESKGLSHGSVTKMVQNGEAFNSSTVDELKQLPNLTRKDLNLIARSGCADQVVAAAGDSQRVQDLLAQIKSKDAQLEAAHADISGLKDRATAAEAREEEAWSMVSKAQDEAKAAQENLDYEVSQNDALHEEKGQLLRECEAAKQARAEAEARAKDAENQLAGARQVAQAAKLRGDKLKAENDALKSQPITAVVDEEEVDRRAGEKAYQMAADMTAELQEKLDAVTGDAEQDVRNAYDSVLLASRAMLNAWQMVKPQFRKLPEEQREALANQIIHTIGSIQGEVTKCL